MDGIITVKELKEKIWKNEGVHIEIDIPDHIHVRDYQYTERLAANKTIDDLRKRIEESINGCFGTFIEL